MKYAFSVFPVSAQGIALILIMNRNLFSLFSGADPTKPLSWKLGGYAIPYLACSIILYMALTILIEKGMICKKRNRVIENPTDTSVG